MSTKFIQKFDSTTAPGAFLDRGSNVATHLGAGADSGIGMDCSAGGVLKYNKAGTIVTVQDNVTAGQGTVSPAVLGIAGSPVAGGPNTAAEFLKLTTGIQDAAATAVVTINVPNVACAGVIVMDIVGSIGAGGAIGAFEANIAVRYKIAISRTPGVAAVAVANTIEESNATAVAGATTLAGTGVVSSVAGAVTVLNTFTFNLTLTKGGGAAQNHQALVYAVVVNTTAGGITLS